VGVIEGKICPMTESIRTERVTIRSLTALRFFAAAVIVLHHSVGHFGISPEIQKYVNTGQPVSFFFILSGFILTCVYPSLDRGRDILKFLVHRLARIWPLHVMTFLIVVLFVPGSPPPFSVAAANFFMVHGWVPFKTYFFSVNWLSWAVSTEWALYLLFPIILYRFERTWPVKLFAFFLLVIGLILLCRIGDLPPLNGTGKPACLGLVYINPLARLFEFTLGMVLGLFYLKRRSVYEPGPRRGTFLETGACLWAVAAILATYPILKTLYPLLGYGAAHWVGSSGLPCLFYGPLILVMAFEKGMVSRWIGRGFLVRLGELSFPIYLLHQIGIRFYVSRYEAGADRFDGVAYLLFWIFLILSAFVAHAAVEGPCRRAVVRGYDRLAPPFSLFLSRQPLWISMRRAATFKGLRWRDMPLRRKGATALFLLSPFFLLVPFQLPYNALVMELKGQGEPLFQVFYDTGEGFNERESSKFYVRLEDGSSRAVRVHVPSRSRRLRIDPGTAPLAVCLESISLKYGLVPVRTWEPRDIVRDFTPIRDIRSFEVRDGSLYIATEGSDPGFMTVDRLSALPDWTGRWCLFLFVLASSILVFFWDRIRRKLPVTGKYIRYFLIFLALVPTPLLFFISSSTSLYLGNQELLGHRVQVLAPFGLAFAGLLAAGILLYLFHRRGANRWTGVLLRVYFIAGPAFLFFQTLKGLWPFLETATGAIFAAVFCFTVGGLLLRNVEPRRAVPGFAFFGLLLVVYEIFHFIAVFEPPMIRAAESPAAVRENPAEAGTKGLPNIYHMVLDEYQTDMFDKTLTDDVKEALGGFVYYPNNVTNYGGTTLSIPSVFTGRRYDLSNSQAYHEAAFRSGPSMLLPLKEAGYGLYGFIFRIRKFYPVEPALFDHVTDLMDESLLEKYGNAGETFRMLWIYRNLPVFMSRRLMSPEDLQSLLNQQGMPGHFELLSLYAFLNYLEIEKRLPPENRYTFLHFLLPHTPYILAADCSYCMEKGGLKKTSSYDQARCTTKLIMAFVETLKGLGRFEESVIVIHADHGRRKDLTDIESRNLARDASRSLLLLKPPGRGADVSFEASPLETMLLDVPPTILAAAGREPLPAFDGLSLLDPPLFSDDRSRPFVIYDDKAYVLYQMKEGRPVFERIVPR